MKTHGKPLFELKFTNKLLKIYLETDKKQDNCNFAPIKN